MLVTYRPLKTCGMGEGQLRRSSPSRRRRRRSWPSRPGREPADGVVLGLDSLRDVGVGAVGVGEPFPEVPLGVVEVLEGRRAADEAARSVGAVPVRFRRQRQIVEGRDGGSDVSGQARAAAQAAASRGVQMRNRHEGRKSKTQNGSLGRRQRFRHWIWVIRICFGFRRSGFRRVRFRMFGHAASCRYCVGTVTGRGLHVLPPLWQRPRSRDHLPDNKKTVVPAKGTTAVVDDRANRAPEAPAHVTHAFQVARTQHIVHPTTGRFSDLRPTVRLLPVRRGRTVDWVLSEISDLKFEISEKAHALGISECLFGTDAHSGATVADSHRVPVSSISERGALKPAAEVCTSQRADGDAIDPMCRRQEKNIPHGSGIRV